MKKVLTLLVSGLMLLSLAACGGTKEPATDGGSTEAKTIKVGVAIYKFDDNFMTVYRQELQSYLESLSTSEVKYEVIVVDGKGDQAGQMDQIDSFITQGVDVLIANLVQPTSAETVLQKTEAAGIPVVFINREPEGLAYTSKSAYVGADARQSGTFMGEIVLELPNKGDLNGDGKVSYVMIVGDPENVDAQYRTQYSIEAIEAVIPVEKLVEERGYWEQTKGEEIMAAALAQYGDAIEVVIANNDGMGLGALQAIKAAGRTVNEDIYLVSVDALDEVKALVESGEYTGTVLNDAVGQSHAAADLAIKLVNGFDASTINNNVTVDYVKVTK